MIRRATKIATDLAIVALSLAIGAASLVVPKRRGQIAFYPAFAPTSFSGDLAILFERMNNTDQQSNWRLIWLSRNEAVARELRQRGWIVHLSRTRPFWTLLRSDFIILDTLDIRVGFGRFRMVQTWHGCGFKRIALEKSHRTKARRWALKAHCQSYRLIAASSQVDATRKALCFANTNTQVTGQPRNDALVDGRARSSELLNQLGVAGQQQVIAYCPTFRDTGKVTAFTPQCWHSLDRVLEQRNAVFLVKRHPRDRALQVPTDMSRIRDVTMQIADVQRLMAITDLLVSDYSSITTDFALTGKPLVFYTYDEAEYRLHAFGFHYDLAKVLPGPFAQNSEQLLALIADQSWSTTPDYRARYERFRTLFHDHVDSHSTDRLHAEVGKLLAQS